MFWRFDEWLALLSSSFRSFGQEVKAYEQHDTTWEVTAYDEETPGTKPSTYVSFIFRYRSPGGWSVLSVLNKI